jgi:threonine dehydratase
MSISITDLRLPGNHAKALAAAAAALASSTGMPIPVWAVMPENAVQSKMQAVEQLGGTVVKSGRSWAARSAALSSVCRDTGATMISADDNPNILLGQGTVGLEFVEQVRELYKKDLTCIVTPCGTGGLLSGLALALKDSPIKVFGVEPQDGADDAMRGREYGRRITDVSSTSIADGLRSPVSPLAWEIIRRKEFVEDIVSVDEEQILAAVRLAASELKVIIEPSAAVGLAAVLFSARLQESLRGMRRPCKVGIVFTGGNVPIGDLAAIFSME